MNPVLVSIVVYVSSRFIDQFLQEEGYGKIKAFFFPKKTYQRRLIKIIHETIDDFEKKELKKITFGKIYFYHSQVLFEELNKCILFNNLETDYNSLILLLKSNSNIIVPDISELKEFYDIFVNKMKNDKQLKKLFIEENYKIKIFQLAENINNLERKIDEQSLVIQEFRSETTFQPDQNWFIEQCKSSIYDLGKRYTSELNVKLEVSEIFEGLGRTEQFKKKVTKQFDQFLIKGKRILKSQPEIKESLESLEKVFDELQVLFDKTDFLGTTSIPINDFEKLLNKSQSSVQGIYDYYITEESKIQKEKNDYQYYHKHGTELREIREFEHELSIFKKLVHSSLFKLANTPFLLLEGEAGIGKSHLIGDIVSRRIKEEYESVFLLGQHFVTEEDPWTQIFKRLQINSKSDDFLRKLSQRAEESGKRIVFFIDAINEGKGNYFWNEFIKSFVNDIKKYGWLGLVLTIRTSYKNLIIPEEEKLSLDLIEYHHYGFRNIEYEASKLFFDNYNIELPNVPLLHPEFQNPLFLKLFCEGINKAGLTRIPDGLQGISSIISFFIKNVNIVLSRPKRVGYSDSLNLVQKSIDALIKFKVDNQFQYIPYEQAYKVVNESVSTYIDKKGFIDELITEGVLSKNLFWKEADNYEEGVYLAYERFEDHLTVKYLVKQFPQLEKEFAADGKLYIYVEDINAIYRYKGLIEAFSIQVPEIKGYEFYNLIPDFKDKYPIIESFIESLLWRKIETINEESKQYVNEHVFSYQDMHDYFWETILAVTGIPNHFFNAHSLHNHLIQYSLPERDAFWTQFLKYKFNDDSSVKRLIDWAWRETDKSHISDESVLLSSITLSWFHTSTNRQLRDCSTKALVCLLENRINILYRLLQKFETVNDPYVYERLFAVTYGCILRTNQREDIKEICEYIYKKIFSENKNVIPHILLRDYARGVIEYAIYIGIDLEGIDILKIRPPYQSYWPKEIPSLDLLESKYNNENYRELWSSIMGFGDFSRYTIGTNSNYSKWSGYMFNEIPIDRQEFFESFKAKLSVDQLKLLNNLDPIIKEDTEHKEIFGDTVFNFKLAIGRKNEEELESIKKEFKESINDILLEEYEKEIEPFLDHNHKIINTANHFDLRIAQRLILSRVIELGWSPDLHLTFDRKIGTGRGRSSNPHERIGKKYQWIAYYEYMAMLADHFVMNENKYEGPWYPYLRDIDPTILISKTGSYDDEDPKDFWWFKKQVFNWEYTNDNWIKDSDSLPDMKELIQIKDDDGKEWLVLEGYPTWSEPKKIGEEKWDQPHKELWCQIRSYLVKEDQLDLFKDWLIKQDLMGRWMPESIDRYEMFSREYYWSPAQSFFLTEFDEEDEWIKIHDRKSGEYITELNVTTQRFLWEEEFDQSKEETISFLKPNNLIYKGLGLRYSNKEGEFIDSSKEVQCFAPNVYHDSKSYLLIRKDSFIKFLKENKLKIVWTILGEKQVMGGRSFGNEFDGRLEINGVYYLEEDKINGKLTTKKI
ncbi:ATP-binding protein [Myroides odoratimimus]|uniref:AVAST type 2 anti-phage system protein Avs2 n=1 Tax=Myroides odoratimimus TaxID=76832 RepID=UPI002574C73E|nr:AVAST type 2 anti-phage system protein Avs2 [Myroides odoratimimus]MDM1680770.1 ATP-binding protein [Myroides odoratimimus]